MSVTFTPEQIETQEFLTSVRGYEREEVRNFLTVLADQIRANDERIADLERRLATATLGPGATASDQDEVARLTAELGDYVAAAARLVQDLRRVEEHVEAAPEVIPEPEPVVEAAPEVIPEPEEAIEVPEPVAETVPEPTSDPGPEQTVEPETPRTPSDSPAPERPRASRRPSPPPEWEELLSDPTDHARRGRVPNSDIS